MKNLFRTIIPMFIMFIGLLLVRCKDSSEVAPVVSATNTGDANTGGTGTNGYMISPITSIDGGQTWRFTLTRQAGIKVKDISHLVIGVDVFCPGSPQQFTIGAWTIEGYEGGALFAQYEEGNGTGCSLTGFQNFFKFEFPSGFAQQGSVTITFTTDPAIQVSSWLIAVKAGNKCETSPIAGTPCDTPLPTGQCSLSQGYFFAKPGDTWMGQSVTFGAYSYNQEEAKAIWESSNKGGKLDVKAAFLQATTIKLNFDLKDEAIPTELVDALAVIDNYFNNVFNTVKLTPTNIPVNSIDTKVLKDASDVLSKYITDNHCR